MKKITISSLFFVIAFICNAYSQKSLTECLYDGSIEEIQNKFALVFDQIDENQELMRKHIKSNQELDKHLELFLKNDEQEDKTKETKELNQTVSQISFKLQNQTNAEKENENSLKVFNKVPTHFGFISNIFKSFTNYVFGK